jgi:small multidrug resistance family-3 protein
MAAGEGKWTPTKVVLSLSLFLAAGVAEVGGGWLVWQALRGGKSWLWAVAGFVVLALYGVIPTFQPMDDFGRVFAAYAGFFMLLAYAWAWAFDNFVPDKGDFIGTVLAIAGCCIAVFWPR